MSEGPHIKHTSQATAVLDVLEADWGVSSQLIRLAKDSIVDSQVSWVRAQNILSENALSMLRAFKAAKISSASLHGTTGYGYDDAGRQACEDVYREYFGAQAAIVRPQIASGTHAITCCLFGVLRPGDLLMSLVGSPYDSLEKVIGIKPGASGSLADFGVEYAQVDPADDGHPDFAGIELALMTRRPKMALIQRSRGYDTRPSVSMEKIACLIELVRTASPATVIFVDNCYGEFVETTEPTHVGADLMAGSLIKNPGGSIAPTGGYVAGRADLVGAAACRLTAPGIGADIGATGDMPRLILQGFHMAPALVCEAIKGAAFAASLFGKLGYNVSPTVTDSRTDIVQSIEFGDEERLIAFCQELQSVSPIDSHVTPEPWVMPGYSHRIVMAGGTFVSGSSIELSADGACRPPYAAYLQAGIDASTSIPAIILTVDGMRKRGLLA